MKNGKRKVILAAIMGAALLAGCGKKKQEETLAKLDTSKYVTLGAYSGQDVNVDPMEEITDEIVETYILQNYLREYATETAVTDRPVQTGDTAYIGCVGRVDGEIFEGGSTAEGQEWDVEIGAGGMIDGFEDGIIGMEIGEVRDVTCVFPDPYEYNPDLAGREAVFTITLNSITSITYPELTADLIADMELPYSTPEEMRQAARDYLETENQSYYDETVNATLMDMVIDQCDFKELPDFLMEKNKQAYENNIMQYASYYGFTDINTFVAALGMTQEQFDEELQNIGEMLTKKDLVVEAIADAEGLRELSEEEMDAEANKYISENGNIGYPDIKTLYDAVGKDTFRNYVIEQRVYDWLLKNNHIQSK